MLASLIAVSGAGARPPRAQPLPALLAQTSRPAPASPGAANPASGAGPRAPREFPLGALLRNQTLATATGGLLVALLIADRLVLWRRPRWLLRLPDEGVLIPIGWEKVLPLGSRLFRSLKYRPRVLDAWVAEHQGRIEQRFSAIATVEQRRHHLGLPVKVGNKLEPELTPERLRALDGLDGLVLISGEGGVGKTSLALRIAGWALEGRLTELAVVPVLVEADLQGEE